MKRYIFVMLSLMLLVGIIANAAEPVLLVIPVHYEMVKFANDIAALRQTYIVSYEKRKDGGVSMYVWDSGANDWIKTDIDAYKNGEIFAKAPAIAFIIGTDTGVPSSVVEATTFCEMKRINNLNTSVIVNTLNESLNFKKKEWDWLARRHKLQVVDLNEDRRRYGRYGKPGASKTEEPSNIKEMEEEIKSLPVVTKGSATTVTPQAKQELPKETTAVNKVEQVPVIPQDEDKPAMDK